MKLRKIGLFLLLTWFCTQLSFAQLSTESDKAKKHFESASNMLKRREFMKAIEDLEKAIDADPKFAEAYLSLVAVYKMLRYPSKDYEPYLQKCVLLRPEDKRFASIYYDLGTIEFQKGDYKAAKPHLEKYLEMEERKIPYVDQARKYVESCDYAQEGMKKAVKFVPRPMPTTINRYVLQYFPAMSADGNMIIYTARTGTEPQHDENMHISYKKNGQWEEPENVSSLNTSYNEGTCSISADGKVLIFTACEGNSGRPVFGRCDLFISIKQGGVWTNPMNMGSAVNTPFWESQPSLSADGKTLYFVSDRRGGIGGIDIWRSRLDEQGAWSTAENLGTEINTSSNEYSPFIHVNGRTLYFSSDGKESFGGADLYMSNLQSNGTWEKSKNLGYPINDHRNQMGLFVSSDGNKGYYSHESQQDNKLISSKIYEFDMPDHLKPLATNYVKGTVYDAKTKKKIKAKIELYNLEGQNVESSVSSDPIDGDYLIVLNKGSEYALYVSKENYLFQSLSFNYSKNSKDVEIDVYLEPIDKAARITLQNIFFETGKWELHEKSKLELDRLFKFLKENNSLKIEIGGHTDDIGKDEDNLSLSEKRAEAVVNYLLEKGIDAARLVAKGYGETEPVVPNNSEEHRAKNRRIEFKVL